VEKNKKTLNNVKNVTIIKNVKNVFYIYEFKSDSGEICVREQIWDSLPSAKFGFKKSLKGMCPLQKSKV